MAAENLQLAIGLAENNADLMEQLAGQLSEIKGWVEHAVEMLALDFGDQNSQVQMMKTRLDQCETVEQILNGAKVEVEVLRDQLVALENE